MSKRDAETEPAGSDAPALRHAGDDIDALLLIFTAEEIVHSYRIKVDRDLALELGLAKEWKRLARLCKRKTDVSRDDADDWTAACYVSCATHQLENRGERLAELRAKSPEDRFAVYVDKLRGYSDTGMFAKGALPGGVVSVWY